MLMCSVILLETSIQFVSNKISLVFLWWNFGSQLYTCCFIKFLVYNKFDNISLSATNCDSVEPFLLTLFFIDIFWISPLSMINTPPVWFSLSTCTAKASSAYWYSMLVFYLVFLGDTWSLLTTFPVICICYFDYSAQEWHCWLNIGSFPLA